jgi:dolichol-phosphate mannosyltransferase
MSDVTVLIPAAFEETRALEIRNSISRILENNGISGEVLFPPHGAGSGSHLPGPDSIPHPDLVHQAGFSNWLYSTLKTASADIIVVIMPSCLPYIRDVPVLYSEIIGGGCDLVAAQCSGPGKKAGGSAKRMAYRVETIVSRLLFPHISDPLSGFFAMKKTVIGQVQLSRTASCVLLEIVAKGRWTRYHAIPLTEPDMRFAFETAPGLQFIAYLRHILSISLYSVRHRDSAGWKEMFNAIKFGIVGLSGILVNEGALVYLKEYTGYPLPVSGFIAIELSIVSNFLLNDFWTFKHERSKKLTNPVHRFVSYNLVSIGGMVINIVSLVFFTEVLGIHYLVSNLIGIFIAFSWNFVVNRKTTWGV